MVGYYGYYSNKSRGQRIRAGQNNDLAYLLLCRAIGRDLQKILGALNTENL